jgi:hypothetical protein
MGRLAVATSSTGFLGRVRDSLTIGTVIALAIAVALTVFAVVDAAADYYGDRLWGNGMLIGPSIVVGFATIQLVWKGTDAVLLQWGARVWGLNLIATVACTAAFALTLPFVTVQYGTGGYQYWLSDPWATIIFPSLLGFAFALLTAMACFVVIDRQTPPTRLGQHARHRPEVRGAQQPRRARDGRAAHSGVPHSDAHHRLRRGRRDDWMVADPGRHRRGGRRRRHPEDRSGPPGRERHQQPLRRDCRFSLRTRRSARA